MPLVTEKFSISLLGIQIFMTLQMCSFQGAAVMEKQEEDESLIPMFLTELILTVQSLLFEPSLDDFLVCVSSYNIISKFSIF